MIDVLIVSYLFEGYFRATRHVADCPMLKRVQRQLLGTPDPRFPGLCILEEFRYASRPGADARPPQNHSCVAKYLKEQDRALQMALI